MVFVLLLDLVIIVELVGSGADKLDDIPFIVLSPFILLGVEGVLQEVDGPFLPSIIGGRVLVGLLLGLPDFVHWSLDLPLVVLLAGSLLGRVVPVLLLGLILGVLIIRLIIHERGGKDLEEVGVHHPQVHLKDVGDSFPAEVTDPRFHTDELLPTLVADSPMTTLHDHSVWLLHKADAALLLGDRDTHLASDRVKPLPVMGTPFRPIVPKLEIVTHVPFIEDVFLGVGGFAFSLLRLVLLFFLRELKELFILHKLGRLLLFVLPVGVLDGGEVPEVSV
mmetsp:Transcript_33518/g.32586  ORF Transcript_33518/g.32586 Transcript_33518/m.32586 type:complete len:278 (+) Transcript_33518:90-923(+)|eukprot:CAMPEP_0170542150 /NCGR_PEP_ID=MMETSP0211-20121228/1670_1 /TAXON_ID=311385 /ORGANISM="Pseudokeronopsis sp., Strain OXSARD2" /LENGTH=277 /DNA_ID=CAMNT_0010845123 /DNA_START=472 /DNA_END=1305 /DNA_ORIENTATION=+